MMKTLILTALVCASGINAHGQTVAENIKSEKKPLTQEDILKRNHWIERGIIAAVVLPVAAFTINFILAKNRRFEELQVRTNKLVKDLANANNLNEAIEQRIKDIVLSNSEEYAAMQKYVSELLAFIFNPYDHTDDRYEKVFVEASEQFEITLRGIKLYHANVSLDSEMAKKMREMSSLIVETIAAVRTELGKITGPKSQDVIASINEHLDDLLTEIHLIKKR